MTESTPQAVSRIVTTIVPALLIAFTFAIVSPASVAADAPAHFDSTASGDPIPLEFYLESARTACQKQQWEIAEIEYQNVLIRESTHLAAIMELADVYERMGKYEHARGLLSRASALDTANKNLVKRALELDKKLCRSLHIEVDTLMANRSYELALPKLALLTTLEPENPDLYYQKSYCYYNLGRYDIALTTVETALRLRGEISYHDLHQLILDRMEQGEIHALMQRAASVLHPNTEAELQSALTVLAKIIELDPDNEWAKQEFLRLSENDAPPSMGTADDRSWRQFLAENVRGKTATTFFQIGGTLAKYLELLLIILAILLLFHSPLTRSLMFSLPHRALLSGELSRFNISEILTLIGSHDYTGTLVIKGKSISGKIFFEHGDVYHCKTKQSTGREALRSILNRAANGRFYFMKTKSPVVRTIDIPLSLLIMDLPARTLSSTSVKSPKRPKSKISELLESR